MYYCIAQGVYDYSNWLPKAPYSCPKQKQNVFYYLFIQFNWLQYFWGIGRIVSNDKLLGNIFVIICKIWTHKAKKEKFVGSVIKQVLLAHSWNVILA